MNQDELRNRLFEILHRVAPEADLARINPDDNIRETLDMDSFDFLQVVLGIHKTFGVEIPEADYRRIATLKGMMEYLGNR
jgi:acyl carrier protein